MIKIEDRWVDVPAGGALEFATREIYYTFGDLVKLNRKSLHKFGRNESVGTTEEDINHNGIEPVHSTTNSITVASSSSAADTTQTVRVEGMYLDGSDNFIFSFQDVALNGQNNVTLSQPLCRVTRIANTSSATATAGDVYVHEGGATTGGVPNDLGTVGNVMVQSDQTTLFAGTAISSTNYFLMTRYYAYVGASTPTADAVDVRLKIRDKDGVYRTVSVITISPSHEGEHTIDPPLIISPNTDIDLVAVTNSGTASVSAGFMGYFADILTQV